MKKSAIALILVFALCLSACGVPAAQSTPTPAPTPADTPSDIEYGPGMEPVA